MCFKTPQLGKLLPIQKQHEAKWLKEELGSNSNREKWKKDSIAWEGNWDFILWHVAAIHNGIKIRGFLAANISLSALRTN
jgi:hypothetical protein